MAEGQPESTRDDDVMAERGRRLEEYIREQEANGGMPPPTDDETSRPSPFKQLPGFKTGTEKVE